MEVHFKFRNSVSKAAREKLAAVLLDEGAESVRPLFRNEKDPELAALYRLDCATQKQLRNLLKLLEHEADVEYAEEAVKRKLVR